MCSLLASAGKGTVAVVVVVVVVVFVGGFAGAFTGWPAPPIWPAWLSLIVFGSSDLLWKTEPVNFACCSICFTIPGNKSLGKLTLIGSS